MPLCLIQNPSAANPYDNRHNKSNAPTSELTIKHGGHPNEKTRKPSIRVVAKRVKGAKPALPNDGAN